jgi:hypothetical protein
MRQRMADAVAGHPCLPFLGTAGRRAPSCDEDKAAKVRFHGPEQIG